jgi:hypothetical protein
VKLRIVLRHHGNSCCRWRARRPLREPTRQRPARMPGIRGGGFTLERVRRSSTTRSR